jgi:PAS domain-containing protein
VKIANRYFENVVQFRYLGTTVTNQNLIQEEVKRRLNSGSVCYHSVQNVFPSRLLSKNIKIRIYKTIILPIVLYECETLSLTVREEHRLRVFENRVLRRIFGLERDEVIGGWSKLLNEELHNMYFSLSIIRMLKSRRMRWAGLVEHMGKEECICDFGGKSRRKKATRKT